MREKIICWLPNLARHFVIDSGRRLRIRIDLAFGAKRDCIQGDEAVIADYVDTIPFSKVGIESLSNRDSDAVTQTKVMIPR